MLHQEFEPPEALQDAIKCFWYDRREFGDQLSDFKVMPDGYSEIIFYFGSLYSASYHAGQQPLPSPFMMGLLNQPAVFQASGRFEVIGIRCYPWTVFELLGLPSGKESLRLFEHPIARLQPGLDECVRAGKIEEALSQLKQYLLEARIYVAVDSMLSKAGRAMQGANGSLPVSQVAAAAHASVRTLERNFKQSSGYTVKDVSGLMRFEQARNHLWHHPYSSLAALALELGYTDQSHFSREFRRYSGSTPAAFARKAKQARQMLGEDFVAFIQA